MGWLTGWSYRKSIILSRASGAVTNYQLKLLVGESSGATGEDVDCGGKCLNTFNDLRFTTSDGSTLLDYWIDSISGTTPNQLATVWVEFDSIGPGNTTFYMYYGKADATAVSNGANTFILFDHFNDGAIGEIWTNEDNAFTEPAGTNVQRAAANTNNIKSIYSANITGPLAIETSCKVGADWADEYGWVFLVWWDSAVAATGYLAGHFKDLTNDYSKIMKSGTGATGGQTNESIAANTYYRYSVRLGATTQYFYINGTLKGSISTSIQTNPAKIGLGAGRASAVSDFTTYFDFVAVRNYSNIEPTLESWGVETTEAETLATSSYLVVSNIRTNDPHRMGRR